MTKLGDQMMPLYMCRSCGAIENTALGEYWRQEMDALGSGGQFQPKCSECFTGTWHGKFPKKRADGMMTDRSEKYVYAKDETTGYFKHMGPFHPVTPPPTITG